ncbi:MAG: leucine-rich repeat protein [Methanomassiliicoccales archaeon]|nr:leucine-rich repeat protein [Methanomassiliicoccales archaeon]
MLLSTTLVVLTTDTVSADTSGYFVYQLIDEGTHVEITGYTGSGGTVVIPSTIAALPVTSIGNMAFYDEGLITSVTIPDGVTEIGVKAFQKCIGITSVNIPDSVESIGYEAFCSCVELASIALPESLTVIANHTFYTCSTLSSVTIPDNITTIQDYAFAYCRKLTSVTVPDQVTSIGNYSFFYCDKLVSITLPDSLNTIGGFAFHTCSSLVSVTIPENVTVINMFTFYSCTSLTSVIMPDNLTTIGTSAFSTCTSLSSVTIPGNVTTIGSQVFGFCGSLTSLTIPSSVTSIGVMVFYQCFNLTSIDVDASNLNYASVGGVLYNKALTYLIQYPLAIAGPFIIPSSVTTIGYQAFHYCTSLTSVTIPSSVNLIMNYGLSDCTAMTEMMFLGGAPTCQSDWIIDHNPSLMIYYLNGSSGFTTPTWQGVNTTALSVPGSPQNLQADAGHTMVTLTWEAPSFNGNSTITNYELRRSTDAGGPFVLINSSTGLNYTDGGLTNGETYWYNVTAVNGIGASLPSETVSATPSPYPGSPTLTQAEAGLRNVSLTWTAPANNGSGPITGYQIYYADEAAWTLYDTVDDLVFDQIVTGLTGGTTYHFGIKAVNADGSSVMSNDLPATPYDVPAVPTALSAVPGDTNITLSWDAPTNDGGLEIDHYVVYQDGVDVMHAVGTSAIVTGLTNGQTYTFKISAHNQEGYGPNSSEVQSTPITVPGAPTLISATAGHLNVTLIWTAPAANGFSPVIGYEIYFGTEVDSSTWTLFGSVDGSVLNEVIPDLIAGTTYHFGVKALNVAGSSVMSNDLTSVPYTVPGAPTLTSATVDELNVTLTWTAPAANGFSPVTGYYVFYGLSDATTQFGNVLPAGTLTVNVTGLNVGTQYHFAVVAVNAAGNSSMSNVLNATIMTAPGAPTSLTTVATADQVELNWTAPAADGHSPITGYLVYRGASADAVVLIGNCTSTTYVDTTVTAGSSYYYKVSAVNVIGEGELSDAASTVVPWPDLVPVTGRIVDANGNGLAGVTVSLENGTSVQTDAQGNFVIMATPGVHTITVSGDGIDTRDLAINVGGSGLDMEDISTTEVADDASGMDMMLIILVIVIVVVLLLIVLLYLRHKKK